MIRAIREYSFVDDITRYLAMAVSCCIAAVGLIFVVLGLATLITPCPRSLIFARAIREWGPGGIGPPDYFICPGAHIPRDEHLPPARGHGSWASVPMEVSDEPAAARGPSI